MKINYGNNLIINTDVLPKHEINKLEFCHSRLLLHNAVRHSRGRDILTRTMFLKGMNTPVSSVAS